MIGGVPVMQSTALKLKKFYPICIFLFFVGIFLRSDHLFENRSLWLDEAWVSLGVSCSSFKDLLLMKVFEPSLPMPPPGFLFIVKICAELFTNNELSLRLFPFLSSILSLFLFLTLLKKIASNHYVILVALGLFVFLDPLIYYAAELKQYSSDLMAALLLYLIGNKFSDKPFSPFVFGFAGGAAMFFSHSAIFVLAALGMTMFIESFYQKDCQRRHNLLLSFIYWLIAFSIIYFFSLQRMNNSPEFTANATNNKYYAFGPITSINGLLWVKESVLGIFQYLFDFKLRILYFFIFLIGGYQYFHTNKRCFFFMSLPLLFSLTASILHLFPFGGRFTLFLTPSIVLFIAEGAIIIASQFQKLKSITCILLCGLLFYYPIKISSANFAHDRSKSNFREAMRIFKENYTPGDSVYLNNSAQYTFGYYHSYFPFDGNPNVVGKIFDWPKNKQFPDITVAMRKFNYTQGGFLCSATHLKSVEVYLNSKTDHLIKDKPTWLLFLHFNDSHQMKVVEYFSRFAVKKLEEHLAGSSIYLFEPYQSIQQ